MARNLVVQLVDDLDGSPAAETVIFGLDGTSYEIDLSADNAAALREAVRPFTVKGRKAGAVARGTRPRPQRSYDLPALRAWASANKIPLPPRGRIPGAVIQRYKAQNGD